jgi:IclR family transcriptional regulator, acetate operon repressor
MAGEERRAVSNVKSADRTMSVLLYLASRARPVPTMRIAAHCGLPRSSTYHLLNAMMARRFVQYYPDNHAWGLGEAAFEIGSAHRRVEAMSWLARPRLRELAHATGAPAHMGVLDGGDVIYTLKETPADRPDQFVTKVGMRLPAHLTAVGRAILMALPPARLRALYPVGQTLAVRTGRGPTLFADLERELAAARRAGYALEQGLTTAGVTCVAATVYSHEGVPIGGVGVSLKGSVARTEQVAETVVGVARRISTGLGYTARGEARAA